MSAPLFHEDVQATVLVTMAGKNPTLTHFGRVHRVSVLWSHGRFGSHSKRDKTILFYHDTDNVSADICTTPSNIEAMLLHACRLIDMFHDTDVRPEAFSTCLWYRHLICFEKGVTPSREIICSNACNAEGVKTRPAAQAKELVTN